MRLRSCCLGSWATARRSLETDSDTAFNGCNVFSSILWDSAVYHSCAMSQRGDENSLD